MKMQEMFGKIKKKLTGKRVLLLTHTDMDGSGPVVIMNALLWAAEIESFDAVHVRNADMDATIRDKCLSDGTWETYDMVLITDISCTESTAKAIADSAHADDVVLLDHHKSALGLNKFPFAVVTTEMAEDSLLLRDTFEFNSSRIAHQASGTSLLYEYAMFYMEERPRWILCYHKKFPWLILRIADYDTWVWNKDPQSCKLSKDLNTLFYAYGPDRWERVMFDNVMNHFNMLTDTDKLFITVAEEKAEEYCKAKLREMQIFDCELPDAWTYKIALCMAEREVSTLFKHMMQEAPEADIYVIGTGSTYSYRTNKPNIDLSRLAALSGGGGHPQAAGVPIPKEMLLKFFKQNTWHKYP